MKALKIAVLFLIATFISCGEPARYRTKMQCAKYGTRKVQVCSNSGTARAVGGGLLGYMVGGKAGAVVGSIAGGSGGNSRCHEETEEHCQKYETIKVETDRWRQWKNRQAVQ